MQASYFRTLPGPHTLATDSTIGHQALRNRLDRHRVLEVYTVPAELCRELCEGLGDYRTFEKLFVMSQKIVSRSHVQAFNL